MGKNVIYRGEAQTIETDKGEMRYLNVEEYLNRLQKRVKVIRFLLVFEKKSAVTLECYLK